MTPERHLPTAACLLAFMASACATSGPAHEHYRALGQEPGWNLVIAGGRIDYVGDYGDTRISVASPSPRRTASGRRYETARLVVEIVHGRCQDVMSGHGYEDRVTVIADGTRVEGCGGARRPDWDV